MKDYTGKIIKAKIQKIRNTYYLIENEKYYQMPVRCKNIMQIKEYLEKHVRDRYPGIKIIICKLKDKKKGFSYPIPTIHVLDYA